MKENNNTNELETLKVQGVREALLEMNIGETKISPENIADITLRTECSKLNSQGYLFSTKSMNGRRAVTRLK